MYVNVRVCTARRAGRSPALARGRAAPAPAQHHHQLQLSLGARSVFRDAARATNMCDCPTFGAPSVDTSAVSVSSVSAVEASRLER